MDGKIRKFKTNDKVLVVSLCDSKGCTGTIVKYHHYSSGFNKYVGVRMDDGKYQQFNEDSLEIMEDSNMGIKEDYKIAVVKLLTDRHERSYGFALYEENIKVGDYVVVNPMNNFTLGIVESIKSKEEYGSIVSKEVISVVNFENYNARIQEKERLIKIEKEKKELQRELDKKISKLKDLEFYERMSKELSFKDPTIAEMYEKLKSLSV